MIRFSVVLLLIYLMFLGSLCIYGKEKLDFLSTIEMPTYIKNTTNIAEIKPFLESSNVPERITAIRRLGQIGGMTSVHLLAEEFEKEPYVIAREATPHVKIEIIEALENIGTLEAKLILLTILQKYWDAGPQCADKRYPYHDRDYISVMVNTLKALNKWRNAEDILNIAKQIALDDKNVRDGYIRLEAYKLYLKADMEKNDIATAQQTAEYLVSFMCEGKIYSAPEKEFVVKDDVGIMSLDAIEHNAIRDILYEYGESILSYLERERDRVVTINGDIYRSVSYAIMLIKQCKNNGVTHGDKSQ